ncbi:unnamed protein product, partial [Symbiodinium pilosum]
TWDEVDEVVHRAFSEGRVGDRAANLNLADLVANLTEIAGVESLGDSDGLPPSPCRGLARLECLTPRPFYLPNQEAAKAWLTVHAPAPDERTPASRSAGARSEGPEEPPGPDSAVEEGEEGTPPKEDAEAKEEARDEGSLPKEVSEVQEEAPKEPDAGEEEAPGKPDASPADEEEVEPPVDTADKAEEDVTVKKDESKTDDEEEVGKADAGEEPAEES